MTNKKDDKLVNIDKLMNKRFGIPSSKERNEFRKEAQAYCVDCPSEETSKIRKDDFKTAM